MSVEHALCCTGNPKRTFTSSSYLVVGVGRKTNMQATITGQAFLPSEYTDVKKEFARYLLRRWVASIRMDLVPLSVISTLAGVTTGCIIGRNLTFDGRPILIVLASCSGIYVLGAVARHAIRRPIVAQTAQAFGLMMILSLLASLTSAAVAPGSGPLIDEALARADRAIFPWWEWREMIAYLGNFPQIIKYLSYVYISIGWQPSLILLMAAVSGRDEIIKRLVAVWSFSIALCILPFRWLTAAGPYAYYKVSEDVVPGSLVGLPFHFPKILQGLKTGEITVINLEALTGLVSFPSFHACAAIVLAWTFAGWGKKAWPMIVLNVGMILSAVPIGGHYLVDIIAGCFVALSAICLTKGLEWQHQPVAGAAAMRPKTTDADL